HLFITVHSTTPPTYQYHVLFRKFLISRLHLEHTPKEIARLARRSARALADSGQIDTAIQTYSLAEDHRAISSLILAHAADAASHGRFHTLESWITRLPDSALRSTPWLTHWLGVCRVVGDPRAGRKLLQRAFRDFGVRRDTLGQVRAASAIIDSLFWEF